jgi:uncharacterized protein
MSRKSRRRFVFDTNVLVSAALTPGGPAREAMSMADRVGYFLLSDETFAELKDVLYRDAFNSYLTASERRRFIIALLRKSRRIEINESIMVCRDPDDDKFLELAVSGKAECVVTRNIGDFPADPYRGIRIVAPEEFVEQMR